MSQTLMLNLASRAVPYAMQVPDQTYEYFKHYQDIEIVAEHGLISMIEAHANKTIRELFDSIEKWKTKTIKEIQAYESRERSMKLLKDTL